MRVRLNTQTKRTPKFQAGGAMPAGAPAPAPQQQAAPAPQGGDPMGDLIALAQQAVAAQDGQMGLQVAQMVVDMTGGGQAAPTGNPPAARMGMKYAQGGSYLNVSPRFQAPVGPYVHLYGKGGRKFQDGGEKVKSFDKKNAFTAQQAETGDAAYGNPNLALVEDIRSGRYVTGNKGADKLTAMWEAAQAGDAKAIKALEGMVDESGKLTYTSGKKNLPFLAGQFDINELTKSKQGLDMLSNLPGISSQFQDAEKMQNLKTRAEMMDGKGTIGRAENVKAGLPVDGIELKGTNWKEGDYMSNGNITRPTHYNANIGLGDDMKELQRQAANEAFAHPMMKKMYGNIDAANKDDNFINIVAQNMYDKLVAGGMDKKAAKAAVQESTPISSIAYNEEMAYREKQGLKKDQNDQANNKKGVNKFLSKLATKVGGKKKEGSKSGTAKE